MERVSAGLGVPIHLSSGVRALGATRRIELGNWPDLVVIDFELLRFTDVRRRHWRKRWYPGPIMG